jgi:hypothetical protein
MRVPEDQRTPGHAEIEVTIAVLVDRVCATRFPEKHRRSAHLAEGAHRAGDASRDQRFSAREEFG